MSEKSPCERLTLEKLIDVRLREQGISRSNLARRMGYDNVSKALRRLDDFVQGLDPPSDDFVIRLLSALDIHCVEFNRAVSATMNALRENARKSFRPYILVRFIRKIGPVVAWQMILNRFCLRVSPELQKLPFEEEIKAVISLYREYIESGLKDEPRLKKELGERIAGFDYYRAHDCILRFNRELVLEKIVFPEPAPQKRLPLANRVASVLSAAG